MTRTKIFHKVTGEGRRRKLKNLLVSLVILALILAVSLWMIVEIFNAAGVLAGFPWDGIRNGEVLQLFVLFIMSFSISTLYIAYYRRISEVQKTTPLYLLVILIIVVLARVLFRF